MRRLNKTAGSRQLFIEIDSVYPQSYLQRDGEVGRGLPRHRERRDSRGQCWAGSVPGPKDEGPAGIGRARLRDGKSRAKIEQEDGAVRPEIDPPAPQPDGAEESFSSDCYIKQG